MESISRLSCYNQKFRPSTELKCREEASSMKKIGLVGIVAGALSVAVIGFAGPAQADDHGVGFSGRDRDSGYDYGYGYGRDHRNNPWLGQLFPQVKVPHVDTSVRN
jgi:hypothetical protein